MAIAQRSQHDTVHVEQHRVRPESKPDSNLEKRLSAVISIWLGMRWFDPNVNCMSNIRNVVNIVWYLYTLYNAMHVRSSHTAQSPTHQPLSFHPTSSVEVHHPAHRASPGRCFLTSRRLSSAAGT